MSIWIILGTLTVKPVELLFDVVCSLLTRFAVSPGAAILCMSLFFCLIATPLRPRKKPDCRQEWIRLALGWLVQLLVLYGSVVWFTNLRAFRGVSFGPIQNLGRQGGLLLFWGGYVVFAVIRHFTKLGYQPMKLNVKQQKTNRNNIILLCLACVYMAVLTGLLIPSALIGASPAEFVDAHYYHNPAQYLLSSALLAAGTFVFWGILYGAVTIAERMWRIPKRLAEGPRAILVLYAVGIRVFHFIEWVIFRSASLPAAGSYLKTMFGFSGHAFADAWFLYWLREYAVFLIVGILCCTPVFRVIGEKLKLGRMNQGEWESEAGCIIQFLLFLISFSCLVMQANNPFIYFNF